MRMATAATRSTSASRRDCPTGFTASGPRASSRISRSRRASTCSITRRWPCSPTSSIAAARTSSSSPRPVRCFLNNGNGRFTLKRDAFPPGAVQAALTGAAMADYDRDGYLDLYVCAYGYVEGEGSTLPCPYYDAHNGPPNRLFHNQGDGTFVDVTTASGLDRGNDRFSFACAWNDVDDDGWPDLAVVNDFGRNNLYRNLRNGTFAEVMDALPGFGSGMSAAFADFNGDGRADLYVSNMWVPAGERVTADAGFRQRLQDLPRDLVRQFAMGNAFYANTGETRPPAQVE